MSSNRQVECTESIEAQRVGTALEHDARGLEVRDRVTDNRFENRQVHIIVDAVLQRHIDTEVLAETSTVIVEFTCAREKVASVLVKRDSHDTVRVVERKLNAIPMMYVDVDV